jgi:hypothetical protein
LFHLPGIEPPDPDQHVDRADITLGSQRRFGGPDDALGESCFIPGVHRLRKSRGGAGSAPAIIPQAIPDLQGAGDVALPISENVSTWDWSSAAITE